MPKPQIKVAGFLTSAQYLNVHFVIRWGAVVRYLEVKVLLADLAKDAQFNQSYERACIRLFKDHWEVDTPLLTLHRGGEEQPPWDDCAEDCRGCDNAAHDRL